jgi:Cof subfamily protein (haloacid dehalogenase superfamily)
MERKTGGNMTDKKIIFFDIDDTLLDVKKNIPPSAKQAIMDLKRLGHEVAIATGRAPFMFQNIREELEIDTYVSCNGQYVVLKNEVIYDRALDEDALLMLTELALEHDHPILYVDAQDMKANMPEEKLLRTSVGQHKMFIPQHDPFFYKNRKIYQALLLCHQEEEKYYETVFKAFDFIRCATDATDVVPSGGSKAVGVAKLTERLGIALEHQYAFGDALNDVNMLKSIPNSVAMGNGLPEAKAAAKYITKRVEEDGILYGLKMVGLL